ncbi:hypothetical protein WR25_24151 [Diploscapter pachys]|uniref:Uncharacterized protein n=1 Tax=Diploscapter pachys TaxID=2018661 RepID=A0A2A2M4Y2_9BILA|nr:hypothetical protein WR25_24151 [Diploscapter pachys]
MRPAMDADVPGPARMGDRLQHPPPGGPRSRHARMRVAVARAGDGHVDGEDQSLHPGCLRPLQRVAHEAAILQHIELEPDRRGRLALDFVDGADRYGRQGEGHLLACGGACRLHFAAPGIHARQADGGEDDRHAERPAEQRRA